MKFISYRRIIISQIKIVTIIRLLFPTNNCRLIFHIISRVRETYEAYTSMKFSIFLRLPALDIANIKQIVILCDRGF